jgi:hypothetical protein
MLAELSTGARKWAPLRKHLHEGLGVGSPAAVRETMAALGLLSVIEEPPPKGFQTPELSLELTEFGLRLAARAS